MNNDPINEPIKAGNIGSLRQDYTHGNLARKDLNSDPIIQFDRWFETARSCQEIIEANAMILSTAGHDGKVTSRTVLLKGYDETGFRFFTNKESTKGKQIAQNPQVSLLFYWGALERQIHIRGHAHTLPHSMTETYFQTRPRQSQLAAWASHQSSSLRNRQELEDQFIAMEKRFADAPIPTPPFWGGYRVVPETIEFWQGRRSRLHDRFCYTKTAEGGWTIQRLSP